MHMTSNRLIVFAAFLCCLAAPQLSRSQTTVNCASDDGKRHLCNADTRGGVTLSRQISGSACRQGSTWGYDANGIWVDRGCRAEFSVGTRGGVLGRIFNNPNLNTGSGQTMACNSDDEHRHTCNVDTRAGVRLVSQQSGSPCEQGRTWGYDNSGIWVDRGCRATFEIGGTSSWSNVRGGNVQTVKCESGDERRHTCAVNTNGGVRMVKQISGSPCQQGSTWGYDAGGIWVDRGCRAQFEVGGSAGWTRGTFTQGR